MVSDELEEKAARYLRAVANGEKEGLVDLAKSVYAAAVGHTVQFNLDAAIFLKDGTGDRDAIIESARKGYEMCAALEPALSEPPGFMDVCFILETSFLGLAANEKLSLFERHLPLRAWWGAGETVENDFGHLAVARKLLGCWNLMFTWPETSLEIDIDAKWDDWHRYWRGYRDHFLTRRENASKGDQEVAANGVLYLLGDGSMKILDASIQNDGIIVITDTAMEAFHQATQLALSLGSQNLEHVVLSNLAFTARQALDFYRDTLTALAST